MTRNALRLLRPALLAAALASTGSAVAQKAPAVSVAASDKPADVAWSTMPIDELRQRAQANEVPAMEEFGRRLIAGTGVPRDRKIGVAWVQRAADAGSPTAAFNVGVMYDRGFVLERDAEKAVEWYRKAVDGGVAPAKHNLALMLREGRGAPQDGPKAVELLREAAHQGMTASMYALGDMYERGGAVLKDPAAALAWFAIANECELQASHGSETPLAKAAQQRGAALERVITGADRERADTIGESEYKQIVAALQPKPAPSHAPPPPARAAPQAGTAAGSAWPNATVEQVKLVQQALIDLQRLHGKADGIAGPATRLAIREFEKSAGLRSTGEPSRAVYLALVKARGQPDAIKPPDPPPPPTSADIAKLMEAKPASIDDTPWPAKAPDQIRAIQQLLIDLKLLNGEPTGTVGPATRRAILAYQKNAGLKQTGEPSQALFESLKAARAKPGG
ncbi:MAG: SEL1-like repeat protein [Proteobacteria bacterium]|nr:SEL1-like repeat protein [Pseudomonadota bacterium]